ncbi:MAG: DNA translocase FtsK 4TM domain-containing protein, partial [Devosia sp.]|nr:DNA translocase FtsK 4TM domain-containing protein [Devosia sp.]
MPARPLIEDKSSASAPAIAITIPVRLIGLVLLALVGLMMAALASWSVDDPSLSFAATKPVQNWLGVPGAIAADLSFQVFGLGIIVMLIPVAMWGWSFVRRRVPSLMGLRLIAWIAAALLSTGVLAFLPVPASWPLPTGLGGLIGAGFANLAALVTGANPQPVTAWLFAIILVAPTLALCWIACGLGALRMPKPAAPKARGKGRAAPADEPDRNGILDVAIGGIVHLAFSAQTALRRAIARARDNAAARREADAAAWRSGAVEPSMAGRTPLVPPVLPEVRVEP